MMKPTIGILGDGQLAQMTCLAGQALGYTMHVYATHAGNPAALVADQVTVGALDDRTALEEFARSVSVVTYDTELLPLTEVRFVAQFTNAYPDPQVLAIAQNRIREKSFLQEIGVPVSNVGYIEGESDVLAAVDAVGVPCVMKTAEQGYDGKGQIRIAHRDEAVAAYRDLGSVPCVVEEWLTFEREMSVIVARSASGECTVYPVIDNEHRHHILHLSTTPSALPQAVQDDAQRVALAIAQRLSLVGLLTVEMFYTTDGRVLVNELAPRPHNSGHHTQLSSDTSQFAQLCLAITGAPLGSVEQRPAAMYNILGDVCTGIDATPYQHVGFLPATSDGVHVYYYGKQAARAGRKMGHAIAVGDSVADAQARVLAWAQQLPDAGEAESGHD